MLNTYIQSNEKSCHLKVLMNNIISLSECLWDCSNHLACVSMRSKETSVNCSCNRSRPIVGSRYLTVATVVVWVKWELILLSLHTKWTTVIERHHLWLPLAATIERHHLWLHMAATMSISLLHQCVYLWLHIVTTTSLELLQYGIYILVITDFDFLPIHNHSNLHIGTGTSLPDLRLCRLWYMECRCLRLWATLTESTCEVHDAHHLISAVRSRCTTNYMEVGFHDIGTVTATWNAIIDH
jgi:hypothetical protein